MNQMNMGGMNPGVAAPMGGVPMMNTGSSAPRSEPNAGLQDNPVSRLNTYIYDFFLKKGYFDCARSMVQDESVPLSTAAPSKSTPSNRRDGDVNGVDGDSDSKDDVKPKLPDDLPRPAINNDSLQASFLFDWFNIFWDLFGAQRKKGRNNEAVQYLQHTQVCQQAHTPPFRLRLQHSLII